MQLLSVVREKGVIVRDTENDDNHNYIPDDLSNYKMVKSGQFAMNKMKAWQGSYGVSKYTGIVSPAYFVFDFNYDMNPDYFHYAIRSRVYVSFFGQPQLRSFHMLFCSDVNGKIVHYAHVY